MKVAIITRSTLYTVPGGDTVQIVQTARQLELIGVGVDILLSNADVDYKKYDLLHFFNITRPADILSHSKRSGKPYVVSTILCSYAEYDQHHRKGLSVLFSYLGADSIDYLKTLARWILRKDRLVSPEYLWKGQRKSIIEILNGAKMILPNSESEYQRIRQTYPATVKYTVVPNGIDPGYFKEDRNDVKDGQLVLCVGRIEGNKNQLNLIKALNNTHYQLLIIGAHAPNQARYYRYCRSIAAENIRFLNRIPEDELLEYYRRAKIHVLPSWFETTGLSSVEAATMGCNIVITDKGDTKEYFGDDAFYCDPADPASILQAVEQAAEAPAPEQLQRKILKHYTWQQAARQTLKAYQAIL